MERSFISTGFAVSAVNNLCQSSLPACQVITDLAAAENLRPAWSALAERSIRNELSISPDWLLTWWQVFGNLEGRELRLGLFHDSSSIGEAGLGQTDNNTFEGGDRLIGLAPLLYRRRRYRGILPFRRLEFLGSGENPEQGIYTNHLGVLAEAGAEEIVAQALVQALQEGKFGDWDELVLPMMAADTPMPALLAEAFRSHDCTVEMVEIARAPYITLPTTWDAYLDSLSTNSRRNIRRSFKALESYAGAKPRLERVTCLADLEKGSKILLDLHHHRWHSDAKDGVFRLPLYLQFHDMLMRRLLERDSLLLTWLRAKGEPLAVLYGMEWAGKVYAYQLGRRTDVPAHLRPGATLLALAIRQAIEAGRREFDLLADEVPFKRQLAQQSRTLLRLRVARPSFAEHLRRAGKQCLAGLNWLRGPQAAGRTT